MYKYITYKINIKYEIIKNKLKNLDTFFKRILYIENDWSYYEWNMKTILFLFFNFAFK